MKHDTDKLRVHLGLLRILGRDKQVVGGNLSYYGWKGIMCDTAGVRAGAMCNCTIAGGHRGPIHICTDPGRGLRIKVSRSRSQSGKSMTIVCNVL